MEVTEISPGKVELGKLRPERPTACPRGVRYALARSQAFVFTHTYLARRAYRHRQRLPPAVGHLLLHYVP